MPYSNTAQFQIRYRGVLQLCIRSGLYESIHCTEIYQDELRSWNPITGQIKFHPIDQYKLRDKGLDKDVHGHYAAFTLLSGFKKVDYMTHTQALAHAERYSKAYQYDLRERKKSSPWSLIPVAIGNKTVLLRLLKKYGVMSIEMRDALVKDSSFEAAQEQADQIIDAETGSVEVPPGTKEEVKRKTRKKSAKKVKSKTRNKAPESKEPAEKAYTCPNCEYAFDEPRVAGNGMQQCPECYEELETED